MTMIKIIGGNSVNTAERRKLRRLGRIAARKMRAANIFTPVRVWVEFFSDEGGMPTSKYSVSGGTWVKNPRVEDGQFDWAELKSCRLADRQRVRKSAPTL